MSTLSTFTMISKNLPKWQTMTASSTAVAAQTKYFKDNIGSVKSASDLVRNTRLFNYAMSAFGLGDRLASRGLMTQVLQQGVSSNTALAHKLNDPNILAFAKAFDFRSKGEATTGSKSLTQQVVELYTENSLEADEARQNPGVGLALYFQRQAPNVTSAYGILADKKLLTVVQTALGITPLTGLQPIDQQAALLAKKINFTDFGNPTKLQAFIARFAAMYDYNNGTSGMSGTATNAVLLAAGGGTLGPGVDIALLQNLQSFRPKG
jgi:hypothetical protein